MGPIISYRKDGLLLLNHHKFTNIEWVMNDLINIYLLYKQYIKVPNILNCIDIMSINLDSHNISYCLISNNQLNRYCMKLHLDKYRNLIYITNNCPWQISNIHLYKMYILCNSIMNMSGNLWNMVNRWLVVRLRLRILLYTVYSLNNQLGKGYN